MLLSHCFHHFDPSVMVKLRFSKMELYIINSELNLIVLLYIKSMKIQQRTHVNFIYGLNKILGDELDLKRLFDLENAILQPPFFINAHPNLGILLKRGWFTVSLSTAHTSTGSLIKSYQKHRNKINVALRCRYELEIIALPSSLVT